MKKTFTLLALSLQSLSLAHAISWYSAETSGNWDSDIWANWVSGGGSQTPVAGLRPASSGGVVFQRDDTTVTLTSIVSLAGNYTQASVYIYTTSTLAVGASGRLSASGYFDIRGVLRIENGGRVSLSSSDNSNLRINTGLVSIGTNSTLSMRYSSQIIGNGGRFEVNGGYVGVNTVFYGTSLSNTAYVGTHSVTGGTFSLASTLYVNSGKGTGVFNQSGGIVQAIHSGTLKLNNSNASGRGVYNLSGGELMLLSSPSMSTEASLYGRGIDPGDTLGTVDAQSSAFNWTGGRLSVSRVNMSLNNTGTGDFNPTGSQSSTVQSVSQAMLYSYARSGLTSANNYVYAGLTYRQGADARLTVDVQGAGAGVTDQYDTVFWRTVSDVRLWSYMNTGREYAAATATFESGTSIHLNLMDGYAIVTGDIFDVFYADSIILGENIRVYVDDVLSADFAVSIVSIDGGSAGDYDVLRLTAIPEPSIAAALLALGALGMVCRRRRHF